RVGMLAEQHRQVAMTAQVQRNQNVLVPKDVDSLAADSERRVDRPIIEDRTVVERLHPSANALGRDQPTQLHHEGRHPLLFLLLFRRHQGCALARRKNSPDQSPLNTSTAGPVMNTWFVASFQSIIRSPPRK